MWGGVHGNRMMVMTMRKEGCLMCDNTSQGIITLVNSMLETEFLNEKPMKNKIKKQTKNGKFLKNSSQKCFSVSPCFWALFESFLMLFFWLKNRMKNKLKNTTVNYPNGLKTLERIVVKFMMADASGSGAQPCHMISLRNSMKIYPLSFKITPMLPKGQFVFSCPPPLFFFCTLHTTNPFIKAILQILRRQSLHVLHGRHWCPIRPTWASPGKLRRKTSMVH